MDNLTAFMRYAADFEKTLADDDWSRLRQYFAPDAVYEVKAPGFPCRLQGPDAIFKGMKKSLDGFDRKFDGRSVDVTKGPEITADGLSMEWAVTYRKAGKTPYVLRGASDVRFAAVVGIVTSWVTIPPLAWLLGVHCGLGAVGGWIGLAIEIVVGAALFWLRIVRGGWRPSAAAARRAMAGTAV